MTKYKTVGEAFADELQYMDVNEWGGKFPTKIADRTVRWGVISNYQSMWYTEPVYCPPMCEGGDYGDTGFVGKANYKYFVDNFRKSTNVMFRFGGHGSYGVIIKASCKNQTIIDVLCGLSDYPVIDDDILSEVEAKAQEEAWDTWVHTEFCDGLQGIIDRVDQGNILSDKEIEFDWSEVYQLFCNLQERTGEYMHADGNDMYVDVAKLVKAVTIQDFQPLLAPEAYAKLLKTRKNY